MSAPSLSRQIDAIKAAQRMLGPGSPSMRLSERTLVATDLAAAERTLEWLAANEDEIKRLMREARK